MTEETVAAVFTVLTVLTVLIVLTVFLVLTVLPVSTDVTIVTVVTGGTVVKRAITSCLLSDPQALHPQELLSFICYPREAFEIKCKITLHIASSQIASLEAIWQ